MNSNPRMKSVALAMFPDDVLMEILLLLPHSKSAIRCSAVCKTWFRLISSPEFIRRFNSTVSFSDPSFAQPYTLFLKFDRFRDFIPSFGEEQWLNNSSRDLIFTSHGSRPLFHPPLILPWAPSVRAATGDWLLVSRRGDWGIGTACVCNPLTGGQYLLPRPVPARTCIPSRSPFGLARRPHTNSFRLASAPQCHNGSVDGRLQSTARIFDHETGRWSCSTFAAHKAGFQTAPTFFLDDAVASAASGNLYFPMRSGRSGRDYLFGMFAVDPFKADGTDQTHAARLIDLPTCGSGTPAKRDVRLAVVRGRLRMSLLQQNNNGNSSGGGMDIRVWELRYSNDDECDEEASTWWVLVRHFRIEEVASVVGLHPNDGDVVFVVVRGSNEIRRYHAGEGKYHKIGEIPDIPQEHERVRDDLPLYLNACTLLHSSPPSWPAPPLPSISGTDAIANL